MYYLVNKENIRDGKYIKNEKFLKNNLLNRKYKQGKDYVYVTEDEWKKLSKQGYDIHITREYDCKTNTIDEYPSLIKFNLHVDNMIIKKKHLCKKSKQLKDIIDILFSVENYKILYNKNTIESSFYIKDFDSEHVTLDIYCLQMCGLSNLGNTCFMNSALQCLYNIDHFRKFILEYRFDSKVLNSLSSLFYHMGINKVYSPSEFRRMFGTVNDSFMDYNQHDAEEFLNVLLNYVDDELEKDDIQYKQKITNVMHDDNNNDSGYETDDNEVELKKKCKGIYNENKDVMQETDNVSMEVDNVISYNGSKKDELKTNLNNDRQTQDNHSAYKNSKGIESCENLSETVTSEKSRDSDTDECVITRRTKVFTKKLHTNIINDIFKGKIKSTQKCLNCSETNMLYEPFLSLPVPIEKIMHKDAYLQREELIERLCVPKNISVKELKYMLKDKGVKDVIVVSNTDKRKILYDEDLLTNFVICYEYNPKCYYYFLNIKKKNKFSFFDSYFCIPLLLKINSNAKIAVKCLKSVAVVNEDEFLQNFITNDNISDMKKIYDVLHEKNLLIPSNCLDNFKKSDSANFDQSKKTNNIIDLHPDVTFYNNLQEQTITLKTMMTYLKHWHLKRQYLLMIVLIFFYQKSIWSMIIDITVPVVKKLQNMKNL